VTGDWRDWRPAIWLAMLGVGLLLLISPPYIGGLLIGGAIGAAIRIHQRRRPTAKAPAGAPRKRKRRR
jgi:hypothetical protein